MKPREAIHPRIEFRYSWPYDQENRLRFTDPLYPHGDTIREFIPQAAAVWKGSERRLISAISKVSGLPWLEQEIVCYLVGRGIPISDPLIMPVYENQPGIFIERMLYCLVERLIMHPANLRSKHAFWEHMFRSLSSEGIKVARMVPVNSVYREIREKYYGQDKPAEESLISTNPDYRRAWEIVSSMGHAEVIGRLRRGAWE